MSKIIISSDPEKLNNFLKNSKEKYFCLCPDINLCKVEDFLNKKGCQIVDINNGSEGLDFRKEYVDFIGGLNRDYHSLHWWATSLSYKGTFVSNLSNDIYNYYCIVSLIKKQEHDYIVVSRNPVLNNSIKKYCIENNIECRLLDSGKPISRFTHVRRCFMSDIYFLYNGWTNKMLTFLYLSRRIKGLLKNKEPYYVIKSWIDKRSFPDKEGYKDLYFGDLPGYLKQKRRNLLILSGALNGYRNFIGQIKRVKEFLIVPQEYFAGYLDYLKVIALNFFNRPKVKTPINFCGLDVTALVKNSLERDYENNEINKNLIYYYYLKEFLKKIKIHTFLFPFENQSWEKMSILAIKRYSLSTKTIGYAHSSFRPYLLNYLNSEKEKNITPLPDKIVTVGKEPKDILDKVGNYKDGVELSEGCALRYGSIFKRDRIKFSKTGNILAALSMDFNYSSKLLRFLHDALAGNDACKVIIREHPFTPIGTILERCGLKLNDNFIVSKNAEYEEDLRNSILVLYTNTTLSMEALMLGIPVAHVDIKEPLSLDPLFRLNSLKWTISSKEELYKVLEYVSRMDDKEYFKKYNEALAYLKRYFYPVEENYLEQFIK